MNLTHGYRLVVAPLFHQSIDWSSRLLVGDGVEEEQGRFVARSVWRAPTAAELAALVTDCAPPQSEDLDGCLSLFALPQHLQSTWWNMLDRARSAGTTQLESFDTFVHEVASLLAFKELPVPGGANFELVASQPGQRSIHCSVGGARPEGLSFDRSPRAAWPLPPESRPARLWGVINLGNDAFSAVLVHLAAQQMHDMITERLPGLPAATTHGELAARFLAHFADYPPIRLRLEPGEGYRLPAGGVLVDACTLDMHEPAVLLVIGDRGEQANCK